MKYADLNSDMKTTAEGVVMLHFGVGRGAAAKFLAEFSEYTIGDIGIVKSGTPEWREIFKQIIWGRKSDAEIRKICGGDKSGV